MVPLGKESGDLTRCRLRIEGVVQGVGFRPTVYRLARDLNLAGLVRNDVLGVDVEVEGSRTLVARFIERLPQELPEMSRVTRLEVNEIELAGGDSFVILPSATEGERLVTVTPDAHVCKDCLRELFDKKNRRYRYPFINCTNCGPRYTIVRSVPYDRTNTTMSSFEMCAACRREYEDPLDRRFHAQPVACPDCGPQVWLIDSKGTLLERTGQPITRARELLLSGAVIAVKGIGGFHLAVDATSEKAVRTLRQRKGREGGKPFAIMARDLAQARMVGHIDEREEELLLSTARPITLLTRHQCGELTIAESVAPALETLGVMLPYSPLHHLLLEEPMPPLVMTSGNPSEEPLTTTNDEALQRLGPLCDALLLHDREIHTACDDSVAHVVRRKTRLLRRARGYVPRPVSARNHPVRPGVLALGGELKNAICLTRPGEFVPGRHLGELTNITAQRIFRAEVKALASILDVTPRLVAHDLHPDYYSTRYARELAENSDLDFLPVQHHHAHLASCLAEHDVSPTERVLGLIFDGTGYGLDGTIWGGELLVGNSASFHRAGFLRPLRLPGGDAAVRSPGRIGFSALYDALGAQALELELPLYRSLSQRLLEDLRRMLDADLGCPPSCGMGRLFDAAAAIIGIPGGLANPIGYEAQAAIELEAIASCAPAKHFTEAVYPFSIGDEGEIDTRPLIAAIADESSRGVQPEVMAARFQASVVLLAAHAAFSIAEKHNISTIALSGGCFNNRFLLSNLMETLEQRGLQVFAHERIPCGDGGLAFGQAAVASATTETHTTRK